jgi:hypothetical protein
MTEPVDFFAEFSGPLRAWGVVLDPFGNVKKQFTGSLQGTVTDDAMRLEEEFIFNDGTIYRRVWKIQRASETAFTAEAGDVVGTAKAKITNNIMRWSYPQRLDIGKKGLVIGVVDTMIFMPDGVILGDTLLRKFGLPVGRLTTIFRRPL